MNSISSRPLAIIIGASSRVSLSAAKALLRCNWQLILAVCDSEKMKANNESLAKKLMEFTAKLVGLEPT